MRVSVWLYGGGIDIWQTSYSQADVCMIICYNNNSLIPVRILRTKGFLGETRSKALYFCCLIVHMYSPVLISSVASVF